MDESVRLSLITWKAWPRRCETYKIDYTDVSFHLQTRRRIGTHLVTVTPLEVLGADILVGVLGALL